MYLCRRMSGWIQQAVCCSFDGKSNSGLSLISLQAFTLDAAKVTVFCGFTQRRVVNFFFQRFGGIYCSHEWRNFTDNVRKMQPFCVICVLKLKQTGQFGGSESRSMIILKFFSESHKICEGRFQPARDYILVD